MFVSRRTEPTEVVRNLLLLMFHGDRVGRAMSQERRRHLAVYSLCSESLEDRFVDFARQRKHHSFGLQVSCKKRTGFTGGLPKTPTSSGHLQKPPGKNSSARRIIASPAPKFTQARRMRRRKQTARRMWNSLPFFIKDKQFGVLYPTTQWVLRVVF